MFSSLKKKLFGDGAAKPAAAQPDAPEVTREQRLAEAAALIAKGNALLDEGKPGQASECYRRATELDPDNAGAFVNLGYALTEQGLHAAAQAPLEEAARLDPQSPDAFFLLASNCRERGDMTAAIDNFSKTLVLKPDFALCRRDLCRALFETGRAEEAKVTMRAGIALTPGIADFHFYLGNLLRGEGALDEAIGNLKQALVIQPDYPEALVALGSALHATGDFDAAVANFERALSLRPDDAATHCSLAVTLLAQGRLDEGATHYREAIAINPEFAEAHCDLATTLQAQGKLDEAIDHYRKAVTIKPQFADALSNLGTTLQAKGRLTEAVDFLKRALTVNEGHAAAHNNLGNVYHEMDRLEESIECYRTALRINPDYVEAHGNLGGVLQEQCRLDEALVSYRKAIELKPDFTDAQSNLLFTVNYHPDMTAEQVFAEYQAYERRVALPLRSEWAPHENSREPGRRLRVGYVSPDFRQHSIRHFLEPLMAHHDKDAVEVTAYAEVAQEDALTARYRGHADQWVSTLGTTDEALARRIRGDRIDILVDLAGHTAKHRLGVFARKPAPVAVSWLGYGYTTGLTAIDYMLTDEHGAPPGSEHLFAEQPWRLPAPGYAFRPADGMGPVGILPAERQGFVTFGSLTRAVRINHRSIRVWSEILRRVPNARIEINSKSYQDAGMRSSLSEKFAAHGIGAERLVLGFRSPPWDVLRGFDVGLDCFPHNSGTTLFESLYMGVPFVTLADRPSVGRLGSSILHGIGHPEWIAQTEDEYIEIAVGLATDLSRLGAARVNLRAEMEASPLRDERRIARLVEQAYREMFRRWVAATPPTP